MVWTLVVATYVVLTESGGSSNATVWVSAGPSRSLAGPSLWAAGPSLSVALSLWVARVATEATEQAA